MNNQVLYFCELIKKVIHPNVQCHWEGEVDWAYLVQIAKEHNLLALFVEGASKQYSFVCRPEYEKDMKESFAIVSAQVRRTSAFLELYESFVQANLHPIVMKGIVCRELYGKLGDHRPSGDEDILIRLDEYVRAKSVLIANGFVPEIESETTELLENLQEVSFIHPKKGLHIELHLNAMGRDNDARSRMSEYFVHVFDRYREFVIGGLRIRTMNHQEHLIFLILHALRHFTAGGFGIRQVLDILLYQERYGAEIDLKHVDEILHEFHADMFWSDLNYIGNAYFGFELDVMHEPKCPGELMEDMIRCGAFGNKTKADRTAGRAVLFSTGNYLNRKNNLVLSMWKVFFPSKAQLLDQFPYLEQKPWMLPVEWIKRWGRFLKRIYKQDSNLVVDSIKISQRRMKLLKKYDLI